MIKVFSPAGWDFDGPITRMVKIASGGLVGADRQDFVKRAAGSENIFLPFLDRVKLGSGEVPVHMLAMAGSERYGPNRNGDGFKAAELARTHDRFVKHAHPFRSHKNKKEKGDPTYGVIKLSAWNEPMQRIELLVAYNGTKEAADRNGGLIADRELEKIARGDNLPVSMATRVAYDVCSACGNKAATRADYCKAAACRGGGCDTNLAKIVKLGTDLHHMHVDNPDPYEFDISSVFRPAERTAYGAAADYMDKLAADEMFDGMGGADLAYALGVTEPLTFDDDSPTSVKLARALAWLEENGRLPPVDLAFTDGVQTDLVFGTTATEKIGTMLAALADVGVVLPYRAYMRFVKAGAELPPANLVGVYTRVLPELESRLAAPHLNFDRPIPARVKESAHLIASEYALTAEAVTDRCRLAAIRGVEAKSAITKSAAVADDSPARDYAAYTIAALTRIAATSSEFPLTNRFVLVQNRQS